MIDVQMKVGTRVRGLRSVNLPYTIRLYGVTEEEFDQLVDEDTRAELLDGVMIVHSPASISHDNLSGFLRALMRCYTEERKLGWIFGPDSLIRLKPGRRVAPDTFFLERGRISRRLPKQFEGAPDLALEVLSPSNRREDVEVKLPAYHAAGVREIWLIDPDKREVRVERRRGRGYVISRVTTGEVASGVIKGFWIDASWLWQEPLPNVMACLRQILS